MTQNEKVLAFTKRGGGLSSALPKIGLVRLANMNDLNEQPSQDRRHNVTLQTQRVYAQLDKIESKLEGLIRIEEHQQGIDRRLDEHGDHLADIISQQNVDRIRIAKLEGLRGDLDDVIAEAKKLERYKKESNETRTTVNIGISFIKIILALLIAMGLWNGLGALSDSPDKSKTTVKEKTNG